MRVLFATTVDSTYGILLSSWLAVLLHAISGTIRPDIQFSLAVGCMPGRDYATNNLLGGAINCTHIPDIPGFEADGVKHHKQFHEIGRAHV